MILITSLTSVVSCVTVAQTQTGTVQVLNARCLIVLESGTFNELGLGARLYLSR